MDQRFGNHPYKIKRYRQFWQMDPVDRPLVGFSYKTWFPLTEFEASRKWLAYRYLTPDRIVPENFMADQIRLLQEGEHIPDDIIRGASPSQAVDWIPGMLGNKIRILPESTLGEERVLPWDQLDRLRLDKENNWFMVYLSFIRTLVTQARGAFPVSAPPLYGPSDIAGTLRGHSQSIYDLIDEPERSRHLLWQVADLFLEIIHASAALIPRYQGGCFDAQYQLWSPGPIVRLQEDATSLYSPERYREFLQPIDRYIASQFECCMIHLHSSSMFLLDDFLDIHEISCFQVNNDVSGPPVSQMIPYFRKIQKAGKPLLIRGSFSPDELRALMGALDPRGLYLYIMVGSRQEIETSLPIVGL
ncbi:MAG: hypothetical protein SCM11_17940 [Bacillota bacterium]|nr:hypothetical protein [Bacillota bacterium]